MEFISESELKVEEVWVSFRIDGKDIMVMIPSDPSKVKVEVMPARHAGLDDKRIVTSYYVDYGNGADLADQFVSENVVLDTDPKL